MRNWMSLHSMRDSHGIKFVLEQLILQIRLLRVIFSDTDYQCQKYDILNQSFSLNFTSGLLVFLLPYCTISATCCPKKRTVTDCDLYGDWWELRCRIVNKLRLGNIFHGHWDWLLEGSSLNCCCCGWWTNDNEYNGKDSSSSVAVADTKR